MIKTLLGILSVVILFAGCSKEKVPEPKSSLTTSGLTKEQLEKGIGPVKSVTLNPIDAGLAAKGKSVFELKCSACHKIDARLVGPPLKGVTERRKPEFIMNMILNPDEMVKKHPEVKKLLAEYYIPMTFQNVTREEARSVLEYFRSIDQQD